MNKIVNAVIGSDEFSEDIKLSYLTLSKEIGYNETKAIELVIKHIRTLLSNSKSRHQGHIYLTNLLNRINNDIFTNNCNFWIQITIKILQESKHMAERILAYKVLTQILTKVYQINSQNLIRDLSICMTPALLNCFSELKPADIYFSTNCLCLCATIFPSVVSSKRNFLENKILDAVKIVAESNGDVKILKVLGFCYSKVVLSGTATQVRWREYFSKLMKTFMEFLNFYKCFSVKTSTAKFKFENLFEKPFPNFYIDNSDIFIDPLQNANRLQFVSAAICTMITGNYSAILPLPVEAILDCLKQFLVISNASVKESHSIDVFAVAHILPIVYRTVFDILKALLISCKTNLIIFTGIINDIVISTLEWISKVNAIPKVAYLDLRCCIYSFLFDYFSKLEMNTCFSKSELQFIIRHLMDNINHFESNITLSIADQQQSTYSNSAIENEDIVRSTLSAVKALNSMLNSLGPWLEVVSYNIVQNDVINTLLHIYRNWFNLSLPYKEEKCRKELLESLMLLLQNAPSKFNPPLETAIIIFREARRLDKSPDVHYLVTSCLHRVQFIMSSRYSSAKPNISSIAPMQILSQSKSDQDKSETPVNVNFTNSETFKNIDCSSDSSVYKIGQIMCDVSPATSQIESKRKNLDDNSDAIKFVKLEDQNEDRNTEKDVPSQLKLTSNQLEVENISPDLSNLSGFEDEAFELLTTEIVQCPTTTVEEEKSTPKETNNTETDEILKLFVDD